MNKKIRILGIFLYFTVAFSFVSCNDYLDVTLLDQLTQDIAGKVIEREIKEEDHAKLIDEFISNVGEAS